MCKYCRSLEISSLSIFGLFPHVRCLKYTKFHEKFNVSFRFKICPAKIFEIGSKDMDSNIESYSLKVCLLKILIEICQIAFCAIFHEKFNGIFRFKIHSAKLKLLWSKDMDFTSVVNRSSWRLKVGQNFTNISLISMC